MPNKFSPLKNIENDPDEALICAVRADDIKNVKLLLKTGANINFEDEDGETALMHSARNGNHDILKFLLKNENLDINKQNKKGATALIIATEEYDVTAIDLLLQHNADPNIKDNAGWNALLSFIQPSGEDCDINTVRLFLDRGTDVNASNKKGDTALIISIKTVQLDVIEAIMHYNPTINTTNNKGFSAKDYADNYLKEYGSKKIHKLLHPFKKHVTFNKCDKIESHKTEYTKDDFYKRTIKSFAKEDDDKIYQPMAKRINKYYANKIFDFDFSKNPSLTEYLITPKTQEYHNGNFSDYTQHNVGSSDLLKSKLKTIIDNNTPNPHYSNIFSLSPPFSWRTGAQDDSANHHYHNLDSQDETLLSRNEKVGSNELSPLLSGFTPQNNDFGNFPGSLSPLFFGSTGTQDNSSCFPKNKTTGGNELSPFLSEFTLQNNNFSNSFGSLSPLFNGSTGTQANSSSFPTNETAGGISPSLNGFAPQNNDSGNSPGSLSPLSPGSTGTQDNTSSFPKNETAGSNEFSLLFSGFTPQKNYFGSLSPSFPGSTGNQDNSSNFPTNETAGDNRISSLLSVFTPPNNNFSNSLGSLSPLFLLSTGTQDYFSDTHHPHYEIYDQRKLPTSWNEATGDYLDNSVETHTPPSSSSSEEISSGVKRASTTSLDWDQEIQRKPTKTPYNNNEAMHNDIDNPFVQLIAQSEGFNQF